MRRDLFWDLKSIEEAREILRERFPGRAPGLTRERVPLLRTVGHVLADHLPAPRDVPGFRRSTVDGYAVRAADTSRAAETFPSYLRVTESVAMGEVPRFSLGAGEAAEIATGGMLPQGADAVVMLEYTDRSLPEEIEVVRPVVEGEDVIREDEDVSWGQVVFEDGTYLRPPHVGVLAALGLAHAEVWSPLRAAVFSTGEEVVAPGEPPPPARICDSNGPMLLAALECDGVEANYEGILPDHQDEVMEALQDALSRAFLVLISGSSSVGRRDVAARVIEALGPPGALFHGVAMTPGKPTIAGGTEDGRAVFGLPGHPVSAQVAYNVLVRDVVYRLQGRNRAPVEPRVEAAMARPLPGVSGRTQFVRVALKEGRDGLEAHPIMGKSGLLHTLARADGLVEIPSTRRGVDAGETVEVMLLVP